MEIDDVKEDLKRLVAMSASDAFNEDTVMYMALDMVRRSHVTAKMLLLEGRFPELQRCLDLTRAALATASSRVSRFSVDIPHCTTATGCTTEAAVSLSQLSSARALVQGQAEGRSTPVEGFSVQPRIVEDLFLLGSLQTRTEQLQQQLEVARHTRPGRDTNYYLQRLLNWEQGEDAAATTTGVSSIAEARLGWAYDAEGKQLERKVLPVPPPDRGVSIGRRSRLNRWKIMRELPPLVTSAGAFLEDAAKLQQRAAAAAAAAGGGGASRGRLPSSTQPDLPDSCYSIVAAQSATGTLGKSADLLTTRAHEGDSGGDAVGMGPEKEDMGSVRHRHSGLRGGDSPTSLARQQMMSASAAPHEGGEVEAADGKERGEDGESDEEVWKEEATWQTTAASVRSTGRLLNFYSPSPARKQSVEEPVLGTSSAALPPPSVPRRRRGSLSGPWQPLLHEDAATGSGDPRRHAQQMARQGRRKPPLFDRAAARRPKVSTPSSAPGPGRGGASEDSDSSPLSSAHGARHSRVAPAGATPSLSAVGGAEGANVISGDPVVRSANAVQSAEELLRALSEAPRGGGAAFLVERPHNGDQPRGRAEPPLAAEASGEGERRLSRQPPPATFAIAEPHASGGGKHRQQQGDSRLPPLAGRADAPSLHTATSPPQKGGPWPGEDSGSGPVTASRGGSARNAASPDVCPGGAGHLTKRHHQRPPHLPSFLLWSSPVRADVFPFYASPPSSARVAEEGGGEGIWQPIMPLPAAAAAAVGGLPSENTASMLDAGVMALAASTGGEQGGSSSNNNNNNNNNPPPPYTSASVPSLEKESLLAFQQRNHPLLSPSARSSLLKLCAVFERESGRAREEAAAMRAKAAGQLSALLSSRSQGRALLREGTQQWKRRACRSHGKRTAHSAAATAAAAPGMSSTTPLLPSNVSASHTESADVALQSASSNGFPRNAQWHTNQHPLDHSPWLTQRPTVEGLPMAASATSSATSEEGSGSTLFSLKGEGSRRPVGPIPTPPQKAIPGAPLNYIRAPAAKGSSAVPTWGGGGGGVCSAASDGAHPVSLDVRGEVSLMASTASRLSILSLSGPCSAGSPSASPGTDPLCGEASTREGSTEAGAEEGAGDATRPLPIFFRCAQPKTGLSLAAELHARVDHLADQQARRRSPATKPADTIRVVHGAAMAAVEGEADEGAAPQQEDPAFALVYAHYQRRVEALTANPFSRGRATGADGDGRGGPLVPSAAARTRREEAVVAVKAAALQTALAALQPAVPNYRRPDTPERGGSPRDSAALDGEEDPVEVAPVPLLTQCLVAVRLQRWWWGCLARRLAAAKQRAVADERDRELVADAAAIRIQCFARTRMAKAHLQAMTALRDAEVGRRVAEESVYVRRLHRDHNHHPCSRHAGEARSSTSQDGDRATVDTGDWTQNTFSSETCTMSLTLRTTTQGHLSEAPPVEGGNSRSSSRAASWRCHSVAEGFLSPGEGNGSSELPVLTQHMNRGGGGHGRRADAPERHGPVTFSSPQSVALLRTAEGPGLTAPLAKHRNSGQRGAGLPEAAARGRARVRAAPPVPQLSSCLVAAAIEGGGVPAPVAAAVPAARAGTSSCNTSNASDTKMPLDADWATLAAVRESCAARRIQRLFRASRSRAESATAEEARVLLQMLTAKGPRDALMDVYHSNQGPVLSGTCAKASTSTVELAPASTGVETSDSGAAVTTLPEMVADALARQRRPLSLEAVYSQFLARNAERRAAGDYMTLWKRAPTVSAPPQPHEDAERGEERLSSSTPSEGGESPVLLEFAPGAQTAKLESHPPAVFSNGVGDSVGSFPKQNPSLLPQQGPEQWDDPDAMPSLAHSIAEGEVGLKVMAPKRLPHSLRPGSHTISVAAEVDEAAQDGSYKPAALSAAPRSVFSREVSDVVRALVLSRHPEWNL